MTRILLIASLLVLLEACAIVPPHKRAHLTDPTMQAEVDPMTARADRKKHFAREGAAGGDGEPAGGGCGCGN